MKIQRTALIIDNGLFQSLSHRLARDYEKVLYWRPWVASASRIQDYTIGTGYDDIERVWFYESYFDDEDVTWIFPDLHYAELQEWLRSKGRQVFGAGNGEELELIRELAKELFKEVGLPVAKWQKVKGMDELRAYLKKNENVFVKISTIRGISETWQSINYDLSIPKLSEIEHELGMKAQDQEFIIEHAIDAVIENGYDGISVDGAFPKWGQWGVEKKDCAYFAEWKPYQQLPKQVRLVNEKLAPELKKYQYRGFYFTEVRVDKKGDGYPIDMTCRMASPAGEAWIELCGNLGEVIEAATKGELIDIKPAGRYAAQAVITASFAEENWLPVSIPDEIRQHFHLYHSCRNEKGEEGIVPTELDMPQIGSVVGIGDTPQEAEKNCIKYAEQIQGYGIKINLDAMKEAMEEVIGK